MKRGLLLVLAAAPALVFAAAGNPPREVFGPITDHFSLRASFFAPSVSTDLRLDSDTGTPGTPFNAESTLGLDDKVDQGRMELIFRMRERNRLRVDYFKLARDGDQVLTSILNFGNSTYLPGDRVLSTLDWRQMGFTYSWSAIHTERYELGVGIGIQMIEAEARAEVRARNLREGGTAVGAAPTISLDGTWQVSRRWSLNAHAQHFTLTVSQVSGSISDYHFDGQYRWRPNVAFGVGWSALSTDINVTNTSFPGMFKFDTRGPEMFLRVSF